MSRFIPLLAGLFLFGLFTFAYGVAVARYRIFPIAQINQAVDLVQSYLEFGEFVPANRRVLAPDGAPRTRITVYDDDQIMGEGHYAALGWNDESGSYAVWLFNGDGSLAHIWPVDETRYAGIPRDPSAGPHAMQPLPDGSVLVSIDKKGITARLDACGDAIWTRGGYYHHAFDLAAEGGVWTWFGEGTAYGQFQYIVRFDTDTGEPLESIGLIEDIIRDDPDLRALFSIPQKFAFVPDDRGPEDIFHPNDVEDLPPELAAAFPMFDVGDLMLSIRNLDMVLVIDRAGTIKWLRQGPWRWQHDPDFRADGTIAVFNNNEGRDVSNIIVIDPADGSVSTASEDIPFFTRFRGKHQTLPNGNLLVTVPEEGRAFEITPAGEKAFEINNISTFSDAYNEDLVNVKWLPPGFFDTLPSCPG